jgi:tetratricopeptide (TPR) repeat protein
VAVLLLLEGWAHTPRQRSLARIEQGDRQLFAHDLVGALVTYRSAGDGWRAWERSGRAAYALRQLDAAGDAYETARRLAPDEPSVLLPLASLRIEQKRWAEATDLLRADLAHDPGSMEARILMARVLIGRGNRPEAHRMVESVLAINPHFWSAWDELGAMAVDENRLGEAEKAYRNALGSSRQSDALTSYNLGAVLAREGRPEAFAMLEQACRLDPSLAAPHYALGNLLMPQNPAAARAHLERFLQLQPQGPEADRARALLR